MRNKLCFHGPFQGPHRVSSRTKRKKKEESGGNQKNVEEEKGKWKCGLPGIKDTLLELKPHQPFLNDSVVGLGGLHLQLAAQQGQVPVGVGQ